MRTSILTLVALSVLLSVPVANSADWQPLDPNLASRDEQDATLWYDVRLLSVEGQGWDDTKSIYDRLPARAEEKVRTAVWDLSRHSAGIAIRFVTDASTIHARWTLTSSRLAMAHMPATGVSGLDLYVRDLDGKWRWLSCGRPEGESNSTKLVSGIPSSPRTYLLYLPLYNGVSRVEIGIAGDKFMAPGPPRPAEREKPIVFYGTSITHGACASRPGMSHVAILGRHFDRPVINLGFSGNGRMEPEVVEFIAELDAAVFVLDCLPNITEKEVLTQTEPCIDIIREAHAQTPILLVEDRSYADSFLVTAKRERNRTSRAALRTVYEQLQKRGDRHIFYLPGEHLLGDDNEGTVDSSHPTDLGFMRQAVAFAEVLAPILAAEAGE